MAIGQLLGLYLSTGVITYVLLRTVSQRLINIGLLIVIAIFLALHLPQFFTYFTTDHWEPSSFITRYSDKPIGYMLISVILTVTLFLPQQNFIDLPILVNSIIILIVASFMAVINPNLSERAPYIYLTFLLFLITPNIFNSFELEFILIIVRIFVLPVLAGLYIVYTYQLLRGKVEDIGYGQQISLLTLIATLPMQAFVLLNIVDPIVSWIVILPYMVIMSPLLYLWLRSKSIDQITTRLKVALAITYFHLIFAIGIFSEVTYQIYQPLDEIFDSLLGFGVVGDSSYLIAIIIPWPFLLIPIIVLIKKSRNPPEHDIETVELYPSAEKIEEPA